MLTFYHQDHTIRKLNLDQKRSLLNVIHRASLRNVMVCGPFSETMLSDLPVVNSCSQNHHDFILPIQSVSLCNKAPCYHLRSISKLRAKLLLYCASNGLDDKVKGFEGFHIITVASKDDHFSIKRQGRGDGAILKKTSAC